MNYFRDMVKARRARKMTDKINSLGRLKEIVNRELISSINLGKFHTFVEIDNKLTGYILLIDYLNKLGYEITEESTGILINWGYTRI